MRAVILDNEAIQALSQAEHPKHRFVTARLLEIRTRAKGATVVFVPTAVRVEAGWDRSAPATAALNRFHIQDHVLDTAAANVAAAILRSLSGVSVADAHLGAVVRHSPAREVVVLTSDPGDVLRVAPDRRVTALRV